MRVCQWAGRFGFWALALLAVTGSAGAETLLPEKRVAISEITDLPGGDIASQLDIGFDDCIALCLAEARCTHLTYNTGPSTCFIKENPGEAEYYEGAHSGQVLLTDPAAQARAEARAQELPFVEPWLFIAARDQAEWLGRLHPVQPWSAIDHLLNADEAEGEGDWPRALEFTGAAVVLGDNDMAWMEYARRLLALAGSDSNEAASLAERARLAALNAYLRADDDLVRAGSMEYLAAAELALGNGRGAIAPLALSLKILPNPVVEERLRDVQERYGFRMEGTRIEHARARPRICVDFSDPLVQAGQDYAPYIGLPEAGFAVTRDGDRGLCVEGVTFGTRYNLTLREGLPAQDGQKLPRPVDLALYVPDRPAEVRFPPRGLVLPAAGPRALPVDVVNAPALDLTLYKVSDRNLLRSIEAGIFAQPFDPWQAPDFETRFATELWQGSAQVQSPLNSETRNLLPMEEALAGQAAGLYVLKAQVPGENDYDVAPAWQWFVVSDLGLISLWGEDGLTLLVRSLADAGPRAGVKLSLVSAANEVLAEAETDAEGRAQFPAALTRGQGGAEPALILARQGEVDFAFLPLDEPEFDLSDRGVAGRALPEGPVDLFLTTDRGAYRAGEVVNLVALARDSAVNAVPGLPLTAVFSRPDGVEHLRLPLPDAGLGGHVGQAQLGASVPRGMWRLAVFADPGAPALAETTFLVEDFLPERIDFDLALPEGPVEAGAPEDLAVTARHLFGAPAAGLRAEGEVVLRPVRRLPDFPGFVFGRYDAPSEPQLQPLAESGSALTGADGALRLAADVPKPDPLAATQALEATFRLRLLEGSGRPVERSLTRPVQPVQMLLGVKPLFDFVVPEGAPAEFETLAVGQDGKAAPQALRYRLAAVDTHYQWYRLNEEWLWEAFTEERPVSEGEVQAGARLSLPVEPGEYILHLEGPEGTPLAASYRFPAGWYVPEGLRDVPDRLTVALDKPLYLIGDEAGVTVEAESAGPALVMVMSDHLIATQAVELSPGANAVTLPVTADWGVGAYVVALALRPMGGAESPLPTRAIGLAYAALDPLPHALNLRLEAPEKAAPRAPLEVKVFVDDRAPGTEIYATLAAVDSGILNLTDFQTPAPSDFYHGQRQLGMGLRDLYGRLIDGTQGAAGKVRSGGDQTQLRSFETPPPEDLVTFFEGPIRLNDAGEAWVKLDIPAFNGELRLMALAWSEEGVAEAETKVTIADPVVMVASPPRFLAPGDEGRLRLELTHVEGQAGPMALAATLDPGLTLEGLPDKVVLAPGEARGFDLRLRADAAAGEGVRNVTLSLTLPDGTKIDKPLRVTVRRLDPPIFRTSRFDLAPGQSFTFTPDVFAEFQPGTGAAQLVAGPLARLNAAGLMRQLDLYPYGCTEQITSKAFPLLAFAPLAEAFALPDAPPVRARVDEAIAGVLQNQTAEGSFGLWGPGSGELWLDAYVTDFLAQAQRAGYAVPPRAFRAAMDNLRNSVNADPYFSDQSGGLAYALWVLAREGQAAIGDLRYYADEQGGSLPSPLAQAQLGAALAAYGDPVRAEALFAQAAARLNALAPTAREQLWRADYGSDRRDRAAVLALAVQAGSAAVDGEALISALQQDEAPLSSQEAAWQLLAAAALAKGAGAEGMALTLDGNPVEGPVLRALAPGDQPFTVTNAGRAGTYLTLTSSGVPLTPVPAGGQGYEIGRSYATLEGSFIDLADVPVGTRLIATVTVTPLGKGAGRLMISDPLPAGFEIENPSLLESGALPGTEWLMPPPGGLMQIEFRQDRFLAAVDRYENDDAPFELSYMIRAVTPGRYHHPAALVEDMYNPSFRAWTESGTASVAP